MALVAGCSVVAGIDGLAYDLDDTGLTSTSSSGGEVDASSASTAVASTSGAGAGNVSSSGAGGAGAVGGAGNGGGEGGAGVVCGDGLIGAGEECDDQNAIPDDGCDACLVVCSGSGEFVDPVTHHCYYLSNDQTTQPNADAACAARGSTLVAISSQAEQDVIDGHLSPNMSTNTWIGAYAPGPVGIFVWTNGELWGYTNWLAGKPDNGDGNEHCVTIRERPLGRQLLRQGSAVPLRARSGGPSAALNRRVRSCPTPSPIQGRRRRAARTSRPHEAPCAQTEGRRRYQCRSRR